MNRPTLVSYLLLLMLVFSACKKDSPDYRSYSAAHSADTTADNDTSETNGSDTVGNPGDRPSDPDLPASKGSYPARHQTELHFTIMSHDDGGR
ncbi:MAG TPA: hypothetical protein VHA56_09870 [Mucilaginibacter sp.]|nr:hypothetical protein [Mucilaginibacter sp.]